MFWLLICFYVVFFSLFGWKIKRTEMVKAKVIGYQSDLMFGNNFVLTDWIEFEIDLNACTVHTVCVCSILYLGHRNAISQVIVAGSQLFDDHKKKLHISYMINAENKSATKHKNKTLCCRELLFCFDCAKIYEHYPILGPQRKGVAFVAVVVVVSKRKSNETKKMTY